MKKPTPGDNDLRFLNLQSDVGLHCNTIDMGLVHHTASGKITSGVLAYLTTLWLHQQSQPTWSPVSILMGDHLQSSHFITSNPDQLSLAIPPWINTMSTSKRQDANKQATNCNDNIHCIR